MTSLRGEAGDGGRADVLDPDRGVAQRSPNNARDVRERCRPRGIVGEHFDGLWFRSAVDPGILSGSRPRDDG